MTSHARVTNRYHRTTSHREMMFRNMVTSLLKHGRIETTVTRAKALRSPTEKMITLGKRGDLHARRQALAYITEKDVVHKLFAEIAPLYKDRKGGYTRVVKLGFRVGDAAPTAIIELVGLRQEAAKKSAAEGKDKGKKKETKKSAPKKEAKKDTKKEAKKDTKKDSKNSDKKD